MATETRLWRRLRNGWMAIAARFGFVQTLMLLVIFYVFLIGPAWVFTTLARRDLLAKRGLHDPDTAWLEADTAEPDLERAKLLS